jgi:hypothetical protein
MRVTQPCWLFCRAGILPASQNNCGQTENLLDESGWKPGLRHGLAFWFVALFIVIVPQAVEAGPTNTAQFEIVMKTLAEGWNEGNAQKAADCFTENAVYSEPPEKQLYRGRAALFKFFGGSEGRKSAMKMIWHHLVFNERTQIGAGQFTFDYGETVHGVAMVKIENGKISNWREYWYESPLDWEKFTRSNPF